MGPLDCLVGCTAHQNGQGLLLKIPRPIKTPETFEHHITLAHSPWANGSVERLNRSMLAYFRKSLSELRVPLGRWPELLPYVQYIHNTTASQSLGGRCPIECNLGFKPRPPLALALWRGTNMKDVKTQVINALREQTRVSGLVEVAARQLSSCNNH